MTCHFFVMNFHLSTCLLQCKWRHDSRPNRGGCRQWGTPFLHLQVTVFLLLMMLQLGDYSLCLKPMSQNDVGIFSLSLFAAYVYSFGNTVRFMLFFLSFLIFFVMLLLPQKLQILKASKGNFLRRYKTHFGLSDILIYNNKKEAN